MSENVLLYAPPVKLDVPSEIACVVPTTIAATSPNGNLQLGYYTYAKSVNIYTCEKKDIPEVRFVVNENGVFAFNIWHCAKEKNSGAYFCTELSKNGEAVYSISARTVNGGTNSPYIGTYTSPTFIIDVRKGDEFVYRHLAGDLSSVYNQYSQSPCKWADNQIGWNRGNSGNGNYYFGINVGCGLAKIEDGLLTVSNVEIDVNSLITIVE